MESMRMSAVRNSDYDLSGRVAVVTGAARGIGRACALRLAAAGADVVIVDRDLDGAAQWGESLSAASVPDEIRALGRRSAGYEVDLVDRDAVLSTFAAIRAEFGRIDILANIAGGAITPLDRSLPSTIPAEDVDVLLDVNLRTVINCCQAAAEDLKASSGSIINVTGASAIAAFPGGRLSGYGAAKIAVLHYTRSLASELGPFGVRSNCISPGITMTARVAQTGYGADELARIPLGRFAEVDDIAKAVEFLAGDMSSYITGQCLSVCGGNVMTPN
jgi:NAD(P)-dependent dehydrogenase (short-subunit alcohol dehydrogenase family)